MSNITSTHVTSRDLEKAKRRYALALQDRRAVDDLTSAVGSQLNQWRWPITQFGPTEGDMEKLLAKNDYVGKLNFSEEDWIKATTAVDVVLELLLKCLRAEAGKYECLDVQKYQLQGSARDGLKVRAPDEFDVLLRFAITGLRFKAEGLKSQSGGKIVAELGEIQVLNSWRELEARYPRLVKENVFVRNGNTCLLCSRALHERVFVSLVDKAVRTLTDFIQNQYPYDNEYPFRIDRGINPPSVNIRIYVQECDIERLLSHIYFASGQEAFRSRSYPPDWTGQAIDVDIVPGILIAEDDVPDPNAWVWGSIVCPRHYVFKWATESQHKAAEYANPSALWRVCTTGYEVYLLDSSRKYKERLYILTALRILKTYLSKTKEMYQNRDMPPPVITTVLRSYHLKHLAFYCILYLTVERSVRLRGVGQALGYMVDLLEVSLEERYLPHFFHCNDGITRIIPNYVYSDSESFMPFDLYGSKPDTSLEQAQLSLERDLRRSLGEFLEPGSDSGRLVQRFKQHIKSKKRGPAHFAWLFSIEGFVLFTVLVYISALIANFYV